MTKRAILQLDTLTCPSCMTKIQSAVSKHPGTERVQVRFNASKIKIDFNERQTTADQLVEVVSKLGYTVKSVKIKTEA